MNNIEPDKMYTASEILENKFFSWINSYATLSKWIEQDRTNWKILNAVKNGEGPGTRYYIKGQNIIDFIANFQDGSLTTQSIDDN